MPINAARAGCLTAVSKAFHKIFDNLPGGVKAAPKRRRFRCFAQIRHSHATIELMVNYFRREQVVEDDYVYRRVRESEDHAVGRIDRSGGIPAEQ